MVFPTHKHPRPFWELGEYPHTSNNYLKNKIMVKIIDYKTRSNDQGKDFHVLIVQGGVEPIKSKATGKVYFSAKTASVPSTFDEDTCKELIGTSFEGKVTKVTCEPYEYTLKETGENIELTYRYEYVNEELDVAELHLIPEEEVL